ncbi:MAG: DUF3298 and DUF4163 domain-containing protein [Firmicutes bacterium]|nr:DUF3298 and DUF4163 domain-containing protein [Bacillota bacterium]
MTNTIYGGQAHAYAPPALGAPYPAHDKRDVKVCEPERKTVTNMLNKKAYIITQKIEKNFKFENTVVLNIDIEFPSIKLKHGGSIQSRANIDYSNIAKDFYRYAVKTMLPEAIEQYKTSKANDFPFNTYQAVMRYTVTLNENCTLSMFFDKYEYTGGAHGTTLRISDNRNIQTGKIIKLPDLFKGQPRWRGIVLASITEQATQNLEENPGIYFDNYKQLIVENFNPQSFNLTSNSLEIYYQQYEIAPYSTGIVVFSLSYKSLGISEPHCI